MQRQAAARSDSLEKRSSMPVIPSLTRKTEAERFFAKLERFVDGHDGQFGRPARIYTDGSIEFISVRYLTAFLDHIEETRAMRLLDEGRDAT